MQEYESIFILNPNLSDNEVQQAIRRFQEIAAKAGGVLDKTEDWGKKRLAYEISKHRKGHYVLFHLSGTPATVTELERNYRLSDAVLKFLTVRLDRRLMEAMQAAVKALAESALPRSDRDEEAAAAPSHALGGSGGEEAAT